MFAIFCRRKLRVPKNGSIFVVQQSWSAQNAVLVKSYSSSVCRNASEKSFTVSYLISSCGLSSKDAISVSKKLCFKSPEKPDAVLKLLREYGFTDAHISRLVIKWPNVLLACPNKTLLPKLDFFRSIGVPIPILLKRISAQPSVLKHGLQNTLILTYDILRSLLESDERVVRVFSRAPRTFGGGWPGGISAIISMLRERGVSESSIVTLVMFKPTLLVTGKEKLAGYVDRAVEMGFDTSKSGFMSAIQVFNGMTESTLKHKMEIYRRCGWSESDIIAAFLRYPNCMSISEKKIMANMDFLVDMLGCKPVDIAECPRLLSYNPDRRIKPRSLVARILYQKGLLKKTAPGMNTLFKVPEEKFLKSYIIKYQKDIPELLGVYQGKVEPRLIKGFWSS